MNGLSSMLDEEWYKESPVSLLYFRCLHGEVATHILTLQRVLHNYPEDSYWCKEVRKTTNEAFARLANMRLRLWTELNIKQYPPLGVHPY